MKNIIKQVWVKAKTAIRKCWDWLKEFFTSRTGRKHNDYHAFLFTDMNKAKDDIEFLKMMNGFYSKVDQPALLIVVKELKELIDELKARKLLKQDWHQPPSANMACNNLDCKDNLGKIDTGGVCGLTPEQHAKCKYKK
jgi:hypothetical protein